MNIYAEELEVNKHQRIHHPFYKNKKYGFFPDHPPAPAENERPSQALLDHHRTAQFILTQKDRPIPSLDEMRAAVEQPDTILSLREQIDLLEKQHSADLERLYALEAEEYLDEACDRFLSKDDLLYLAEGENNPELKESYEKLKTLYEDGRYEVQALLRWGHDFELLRHTHLHMVNSLRKRIQDIEEKEQAAQTRREKDFPLSIADFEARTEDLQRLAVLVLTAPDALQRERLMERYQLSWRQVEPLYKELKSNVKFRDDILARKQAIDQSSDPRVRKP